MCARRRTVVREFSFKTRAAVLALGVCAFGSTNAQSTAANADDAVLETVLITAKRADRVSKGATGLDLAIKDTPQSISVVTQDQMENFGASDLNAALKLATGINVEEWETNRTNYLARGFEIKNTQVDGVGLPNDWGIVTGAMDSFGYEKLEVIRGANGLLTGVGNSAGTINYVRKRPTNTARGNIAGVAGSFEHRRIEADYSTPFTANGEWAGRIVAATEEKDSWLRGLSNDRTFVYGVIDGQLGERSTLTVGYSIQDANTDGNMWGALVLSNSDGSQAEFPRNASTTQDWTFWDTQNKTAFAEYTYALSDAWDVKLTYNHRDYEEDSKLFFAFTTVGLDRNTGLGLLGNPGNWRTQDEAQLLDLTVDGDLTLFGRTQQLIFGVSYAVSERELFWRPVDRNDPSFGLLPAFPYAGNAIAEPRWGAREEYSTNDQTLKRAYGASRIALTDKLKAVVGFNWAEYHRDGHQTGTRFDQTEREVSPYAGLTYELTDDSLAYASYSDIYQPQDYYDQDHRYLDPSKGVNYEVGVKAEWFDRRLLTTVAVFTAEQQGLGTFAGMTETGTYFYKGVDVDSKGVELEMAGRLNEYIEGVLGFTTLKLEGADGRDIYEWVPRRTVNLLLTAKLPRLTDVSFGLGGKWQSDISKVDEYTSVTIRQRSYALLNAYVRWDVSKSMSVRANASNLTDEKFITSLYQIGYYGAPRNYSVSLNYRF